MFNNYPKPVYSSCSKFSQYAFNRCFCIDSLLLFYESSEFPQHAAFAGFFYFIFFQNIIDTILTLFVWRRNSSDRSSDRRQVFIRFMDIWFSRTHQFLENVFLEYKFFASFNAILEYSWNIPCAMCVKFDYFTYFSGSIRILLFLYLKIILCSFFLP